MFSACEVQLRVQDYIRLKFSYMPDLLPKGVNSSKIASTDVAIATDFAELLS